MIHNVDMINNTSHFFQQGSKLFEGIYGDKGSNNAGEYLSVDPLSGEIMNYVDSDYLGGGFGFMKLTPVTN